MAVATFQQNVSGYTGVKDVLIRAGTHANTNFEDQGLNAKEAGGTADFTRVSLISFDLSSLSAGDTVTAVSLQLTLNGAGNGTGTIHLFKLLRTDWVANQATWNIYKTSSNWSTAGCRSAGNDLDGDYSDGDPGSLSSYTVSAADVDGTVKTFGTSAAFVTVAQAAMGGTLHLVFHEVANQNVNNSIYDSAAATAGNRPLLTVTYTPAGGTPAVSRRVISKTLRR